MLARRALFALVAGLGALTVAPAAAAPKARTMPTGRGPSAVAVNSVTGAVYVANGDGSITVLGRDPAHVGGTPGDLAIDESTGRVYVANRLAGTVTVLDAAGALQSVVPSGVGAAVLDVASDDNKVYVGSGRTGSVGVVDTIGSVLDALLSGPGQGFGGVRVDAGRQLAYLTNIDGNSVEVLDLDAGDFVASIPVGQAPTGLALHTASNTLYVANSGIHHLSVVDCATRTERTTILLRSEASAVAVRQSDNTVYANGGPDGIVRIDGSGGKTSGELSLGINPGGVAVDQRTGTVYVTDPVHDQVHVIDGF